MLGPPRDATLALMPVKTARDSRATAVMKHLPSARSPSAVEAYSDLESWGVGWGSHLAVRHVPGLCVRPHPALIPDPDATEKNKPLSLDSSVEGCDLRLLIPVETRIRI